VSIIVPMYNAERFIAITIASILQEKDIAIEVIIVDDKSTDRSAERVQQVCDGRVRVIDGPGGSAPGAMNAGFACAAGSIVMICAADDLYPHARISQQVQWLNTHPEYGAVCGSYSTIDSRGNLIAELHCGDTPTEITDELTNGKLRTSFCTYAVR